MNKTWAVVAVGVILIGAFSAVACGNANQDRQGPESTSSPAVASAPSLDEGLQLISVKENLPARYDIPWEDGWLSAEQALEQALPAIGRAGKTDSLVPVSVGDEIFVGLSGRLDATRELEPLEGIVAGETERNGDGLTVKTADGRTVNVLLPREMISEAAGPGSETRTRHARVDLPGHEIE